MINGIQIIAEVKTESPFGFKSEHTWDELFLIADEIGDIISIHTDKRWGGSLKLIEKARKMTKKPILAKGIHKDDSQITAALNAGADYVLVVGRIPRICREKSMIEPNTLAELKQLSKSDKAVWNARNLKNGEPKIELFEQARAVFDGWLCQASFIHGLNDIKSGANAILIGENLLAFYNTTKLTI